MVLLEIALPIACFFVVVVVVERVDTAEIVRGWPEVEVCVSPGTPRKHPPGMTMHRCNREEISIKRSQGTTYVIKLNTSRKRPTVL